MILNGTKSHDEPSRRKRSTRKISELILPLHLTNLTAIARKKTPRETGYVPFSMAQKVSSLRVGGI